MDASCRTSAIVGVTGTRQEVRRTRGALSFLAGLLLSSSQTPLVGREDVQLSERAVELDWSVKIVAEETERLRLDVGLLPHT